MNKVFLLTVIQFRLCTKQQHTWKQVGSTFFFPPAQAMYTADSTLCNIPCCQNQGQEDLEGMLPLAAPLLQLLQQDNHYHHYCLGTVPCPLPFNNSRLQEQTVQVEILL